MADVLAASVALARVRPSTNGRTMALVQSSSLMTLGLKGDRGMTRHNSVPALMSKPTEFKFGRPDYAVRTDTHTLHFLDGPLVLNPQL